MTKFFRLAVFSFLIFLPLAVFARNIEIVVEDDDLHMPLEGAVISLRDGTRFVCNHNGVATVVLPDDRQTVVQITYPGYETRRLTIPAVSATASADAPARLTVSLRLGGVMENKELVVEARRPETSETQTGRSVAISERELERVAEIGIIEDVMSAVKLLPGVGYTGMFGALPSIRGGDPGDLVAAFDGFYLETPYHWVGAVSIFDPKMVSSARLSHGVFSARYGHSISGLLEITSKSPSFTETEFETAIGTSSASVNVSIPLDGKGGILFMGKVSYWDLYVGMLKGISALAPKNEMLGQINSVSTAPYIRSAAVAANYRFTPDLDWRLNAFFGSDGVGAASTVDYDDDDVDGSVKFSADYGNYQGFLISGITASPSPALAVRATGGVGFTRRITDDVVNNDVTAKYNEDFLNKYPILKPMFGLSPGSTYTAPDVNVSLTADHTVFNAQVRGDLDWDLGKGFIAAFGVHALYSLWAQNQDIKLSLEFPLSELADHLDQLPEEMRDVLNNPFFKMFTQGIPELAIVRPMTFNSELMNHGLTSSAYSLLEYKSPNQRFGGEIGLRMDHLYFQGKDFSAYTMPALNPRLNLDFNIFKNKGIVDSLDFTIGTGLFSSVNMLVSFVDGDRVSMATDNLKFNRSWTSIAGVRVDLEQGYSFNIEGYYKYVFDRAYIDADIISEPNVKAKFHFDGIGHVGGFDLQLQKLESRYWDGWISYTFTWAQYKDPKAGGEGVNQGGINAVGGWYYPSFHRFHNANVVLNIKPLRWFNISTRFGFASGQPSTKRVVGEIYSYPVIYINEEEEDDDDDNELKKVKILQKYRRDTISETPSRDPWSIPLDIKFSFFLFDRKGRVGTEIYLAAENLMAIFPFYPYQTDGNTRFNDYTGKVDDTGARGSGMFDFPIPMVSFGFKWRY